MSEPPALTSVFSCERNTRSEPPSVSWSAMSRDWACRSVRFATGGAGRVPDATAVVSPIPPAPFCEDGVSGDA
ncbi:hypothetical protein QP028_11180 [Corynebacterium suedekumii]|nr:hypothetical protein QP028_11180 [Corynebacterium suedekumii]